MTSVRCAGGGRLRSHDFDSAAIRRMRNRIPAHYNVFDQFDRSIVSIDTLKRDAQIRDAIRALLTLDDLNLLAKNE